MFLVFLYQLSWVFCHIKTFFSILLAALENGTKHVDKAFLRYGVICYFVAFWQSQYNSFYVCACIVSTPTHTLAISLPLSLSLSCLDFHIICCHYFGCHFRRALIFMSWYGLVSSHVTVTLSVVLTLSLSLSLSISKTFSAGCITYFVKSVTFACFSVSCTLCYFRALCALFLPLIHLSLFFPGPKMLRYLIVYVWVLCWHMFYSIIHMFGLNFIWPFVFICNMYCQSFSRTAQIKTWFKWTSLREYSVFTVVIKSNW